MKRDGQSVFFWSISMAAQADLGTLGQLTAEVAHEFRNVMMVIMGALDLLECCNDPSDRTDFIRALARAREAAAHGEALTDSLLDFSSLPRAKPCALDVDGILASLCDLLRWILPKTIAVELVSGGAGAILACAGEFRSAVLNLALNARDAMPRGGKLVIRSQRVCFPEPLGGPGGAAYGDCIAISVRDTGLGMDHYVREHAFERFFTTKAAGKGSGLGLDQVARFVAAAGGEIEMQSESGAGTCITMYFRRHEPDE
jgi:two-component system cell cycle sensor histidine kinase/response regulator CckA